MVDNRNGCSLTFCKLIDSIVNLHYWGVIVFGTSLPTIAVITMEHRWISDATI
jgi:hypothetical protein